MVPIPGSNEGKRGARSAGLNGKLGACVLYVCVGDGYFVLGGVLVPRPGDRVCGFVQGKIEFRLAEFLRFDFGLGVVFPYGKDGKDLVTGKSVDPGKIVAKPPFGVAASELDEVILGAFHRVPHDAVSFGVKINVAVDRPLHRHIRHVHLFGSIILFVFAAQSKKAASGKSRR